MKISKQDALNWFRFFASLPEEETNRITKLLASSMQNIIRSDASESPFGIQQLRPASDPAIGRIRSHALSKIV